jgi:sulfatase modifying factor 1
MLRKCALRSLFIGCLALVGCQQSSDKKESPQASDVPTGFVLIPGGTYELGKKEHKINPQRTVQVGSFLLSEAEVTNAQWLSFIEATDYKTTAEKYHNAMTFYVGLDEFKWVMDSTASWRFPFGKNQEGIQDKMDHPVTCISYLDILKYCEWAKVSLPTLDQWEIACRANTKGPYHFEGGLNELNNYGNIWQSETHQKLTVKEDYLYTSPVKNYKPNPWGLYDMYGNCFEFCADNPEVWKDNKKVACARGGSWWCSSNSCNFFNSYDIGKVNKRASFSNHGFRVVKTPTEQ